MARLTALRVICAAATLLAALAVTVPAQADSAGCQKAIVTQLRRFKKVYLKANIKCLKNENAGTIGGPCPDTATLLKIQQKTSAINAAIASACTPADLAALNFRTDCVYEANTSGKEASCAAMPVLSGPDIDPSLLEGR
jgi:hypothetical protein